MAKIDENIILDLSNTYTKQNYVKSGNTLKGILTFDDIDIEVTNDDINIVISDRIQNIVTSWPDNAKQQLCKDINDITNKYLYTPVDSTFIFRIKYDLIMVMTAEF